MVYTPHDVNKIQKIADLTVGLAEAELTLPKLFTRETVDKFRGAEGDKITFRVDGRLPYRRFAFRNDRSKSLLFDVYKETKVDITWGDRLYSGVELTDEQADFDTNGWAKLSGKQGAAVAQGIQDECAKALEAAPYNVTIGLGGASAPGDIRAAFFEARRVFNLLRVPDMQRFVAMGSNVEMAVLMDKDLISTTNVSEARAESALANATIGRIAGFTAVLDLSIDPDTAYFFVPSAFVLATGAPVVPNSVPFGTTASFNGFTLRWIKDYYAEKLVDRSIVDSYVGVSPVKDLFFEKSVYTDDVKPVTLEPATDQFFVRGIKLSLTGASVYPADASALAAETGIKAAQKFIAPSKRP